MSLVRAGLPSWASQARNLQAWPAMGVLAGWTFLLVSDSSIGVPPVVTRTQSPGGDLGRFSLHYQPWYVNFGANVA
jgi:hypothetical protein